MVKKSKSLLVLTLVIVLCLASIQIASAAGDPIYGTEASPAQAAITKVLKVPFGTSVPNATFKFTVRAIDVDDRDYDGNATTQTANMPLIGQPTTQGGVFNYVEGTGIYTLEFGKATNPGETLRLPDPDVNGTSTWYYETASLFNGVVWPHAGVFTYEVTEEGSTYPIADLTKETMTYSLAKYTVRVYVKESTTNPGTYYVYAIAAVVQTVDHDGQDEGDKVDPTPGGSTTTLYDHSDMTFTNTYWKHTGGTDPTDPDDWTLAVSKKVTGDFGDRSLYFDFKISVTKPHLVPDIPPPLPYIAYIVEVDSAGVYSVVTDLTANKVSIASQTDASNRPYFEIASGQEVTFSLKDGQYLVFLNTTVGATYEVTEYKSALYIPKVEVIYNGASLGVETKEKDHDLTVPHAGNTNPNLRDKLYVGEAANRANFENNRDSFTPTGLNVNNLPFIGMIVLAIGSLFVFIAFKSRKRKSPSQF